MNCAVPRGPGPRTFAELCAVDRVLSSNKSSHCARAPVYGLPSMTMFKRPWRRCGSSSIESKGEGSRESGVGSREDGRGSRRPYGRLVTRIQLRDPAASIESRSLSSCHHLLDPIFFDHSRSSCPGPLSHHFRVLALSESTCVWLAFDDDVQATLKALRFEQYRVGSFEAR
jgi:hypothetical protein